MNQPINSVDYCPARRLICTAIECIDCGDIVAAKVYNFISANALNAKKRLSPKDFKELYDFDYINSGLLKTFNNAREGEGAMEDCPARSSLLRAIEELDHRDIDAAIEYNKLAGDSLKAMKDFPKKKKKEEKPKEVVVAQKEGVSVSGVVFGVIVALIIVGTLYMKIAAS